MPRSPYGFSEESKTIILERLMAGESAKSVCQSAFLLVNGDRRKVGVDCIRKVLKEYKKAHGVDSLEIARKPAPPTTVRMTKEEIWKDEYMGPRTGLEFVSCSDMAQRLGIKPAALALRATRATRRGSVVRWIRDGRGKAYCLADVRRYCT